MEENKMTVMIVAIVVFGIISIASIIGLTTYTVHKASVDNGYVQTTVQGSNCVVWTKEKQ